MLAGDYSRFRRLASMHSAPARMSVWRTVGKGSVVRAFHSDIERKASVLRRVAARREAGQLMRTNFPWEEDAGCAVGCAIYGEDFQAVLDDCNISSDNPTTWPWAFQHYEHELGIPQELAYVKSAIYYGMPYPACQEWPERFLKAIEPGADLARMVWTLLNRLLMSEDFNAAIPEAMLRSSVQECLWLLRAHADGGLPTFDRMPRILNSSISADDHSVPEWHPERLEARDKRQREQGVAPIWWPSERGTARQVGEYAAAAVTEAARALWYRDQIASSRRETGPASPGAAEKYVARSKLAAARRGIGVAMSSVHAMGWAVRGRLEGIAQAEIAANNGAFPAAPECVALRGAWTEDGALRAIDDLRRRLSNDLATLDAADHALQLEWPRGLVFRYHGDSGSEAAHIRIADTIVELLTGN